MYTGGLKQLCTSADMSLSSLWGTNMTVRLFFFLTPCYHSKYCTTGHRCTIYRRLVTHISLGKLSHGGVQGVSITELLQVWNVVIIHTFHSAGDYYVLFPLRGSQFKAFVQYVLLSRSVSLRSSHKVYSLSEKPNQISWKPTKEIPFWLRAALEQHPDK